VAMFSPHHPDVEFASIPVAFFIRSMLMPYPGIKSLKK
jgi:hypothetical protein